jgi:hypothetical protein
MPKLKHPGPATESPPLQPSNTTAPPNPASYAQGGDHDQERRETDDFATKRQNKDRKKRGGIG